MKKNKNLSFDTIVAAVGGDKEAIKKVLNFYDGYISKLSLRKMYDDYGNVYMVVDSELKGRLQTAVMNMTLNFQITVV
ncbi:putative conjugative transposon excisionase [Clostridium sp. DL-VIII]|uniref:helix-turn-helix domain-containing protein n=1 Tax=Clostridium sp. DL-VIII TaxID=641107 RepID=UPI00023B08D0|nr:helix-turn-helix domain-containing protein [Clostridium sp. DL-VIII]EHJ02250.1 putative conjugative transposon excisionase [Clostridium sp. DL-VIII]